MSVAESRDTALPQQLAAILGEANVLTDEASCVLYAQDVYTKAQAALAVARPGSTEELAELVA
ncbi:MAG: hypothetical protein OEQ74_09490, partial [Gammaproteobacteria bacterium]|nr:hypothetical protein [Gammaproteobacteria bacterium]